MQAQTQTTGATTPTSPLEFTTPPVAKEATQLSSTNCARFTVLCTYLVTIYCTIQICCTLYLSSYDSGLLSRCHISWMPILPSESSSQREVWRLIVPGERKFVVYCSLFQKNYPGTHLAWSYKWKQPFQFRSLFISLMSKQNLTNKTLSWQNLVKNFVTTPNHIPKYEIKEKTFFVKYPFNVFLARCWCDCR